MKKLIVFLGCVMCIADAQATDVYSGESSSGTYCIWGTCLSEDIGKIDKYSSKMYNGELSTQAAKTITYMCAYRYDLGTDRQLNLLHAQLLTATECQDGYVRVDVNPTDSGGISTMPAGCEVVQARLPESELRVPYSTCVCGKTDSECASKITKFASYGTVGKERRLYSYLHESSCSCVERYEYRCAANYWGDPGQYDRGTCTKCDSLTDTAGVVHPGLSVAGENQTQDSCYISKDEKIDDSYGVFHFQTQCNISLP